MISDPLQTTYKVIVQQEGKPDVTLPCKGIRLIYSKCFIRGSSIVFDMK
jgi:hypothetical protein